MTKGKGEPSVSVQRAKFVRGVEPWERPLFSAYMPESIGELRGIVDEEIREFVGFRGRRP